MNIHVTFKKMSSSEAIKTKANEKCDKISHYIPKDSEVYWVFYLEGDVHVADLKIHGPHVKAFAQSKTSDMYHSIDEVLDKVEKQLKKHKEITKDHLHRDRS